MNDLDMELERAIQMRRGIGQDQYVDGLELPSLGIGQPGGAAGAWKPNGGDSSVDQSAGGRSVGVFFFYPILLSMLLTGLVVFVFIKLRGLLLFRRLLGLFVSN